ncbi:hypothetical protein C0J52_03911 [Blattella germanica]|nr:hypothetical protein C0J52_03911 [Blattella germanica]
MGLGRCPRDTWCSCVAGTDICSGRTRLIVGSCYEHMWSVGVVTLAALGYALDDWKQLQHAISVPTLLILTAYNWIPDSPKWLMAKGRYDEARVIMEEAASFNGTKVAIPDVIPHPQSSGDREVMWCETLKQTHCLAMHIMWTATVVTYYGALLNVKNLGPHLHFNTVVAGAAEVLGVLLGLFIILWFNKRKWQLLGVILVVGGGACIASWALPLPTNGGPYEWVWLGLAMMGRVAIAVSLTVLQVKSGELLPQVSIFSCVTLARVFLLSAPFIGFLAMYGEAVPLSIFGSLTVIGGLASFFVKKSKEETQKELNIIWTVPTSEGSYKPSVELNGTEVSNGTISQSK